MLTKVNAPLGSLFMRMAQMPLGKRFAFLTIVNLGLIPMSKPTTTMLETFTKSMGITDLFTYGVAAEAQLVVGNNSNIVADTGMIYSATDSSGAQSAYAIINNTPQQYPTYQLNGYYQECEGNSPDDCSWESNSIWGIWGSDNGLSVELNLAPPPPTPTLSATTSGTPSMYGQPITFTATLTGGASGTVAFISAAMQYPDIMF